MEEQIDEAGRGLEDRSRCFMLIPLSVSEGDQKRRCCGASEDEGWFYPVNHADGAPQYAQLEVK